MLTVRKVNFSIFDDFGIFCKNHQKFAKIQKSTKEHKHLKIRILFPRNRPSLEWRGFCV